jgi:outer membrane protein OmpA-like peptidoglycan-associated protein
MKRTSLLAVLAIATLLAGCATKSYVRKETGPVVNKVNELDDLTAKTTTDIKDVDARSQKGIQQATATANEADQKATAAGQAADRAQGNANQAASGANTLTNTVANLDNYKPVTESAVHFAFNKYDLTAQSRQALDELAAQIPNVKNYIVVVDGNTDSVGSAEYNYVLSQRRADAVIHYLATKHDVPARKFYVIGMGKDKPQAENDTAKGRAENRRVDVRLMTNLEQPTSASAKQP